MAGVHPKTCRGYLNSYLREIRDIILEPYEFKALHRADIIPWNYYQW
jgi:hypothetical protein